MNFEELKQEAAKHGYNLIKKPDWDCACYCSYPNDNYKRKNGRWKCVDNFKFMNISKQGMTHCKRKESK